MKIRGCLKSDPLEENVRNAAFRLRQLLKTMKFILLDRPTLAVLPIIKIVY